MIEEIFNFIKGIAYFIAYSLGYKGASNERDAKESRADLEWRNSIEQQQQEIMAKYDLLKQHYPDDWIAIDELRKRDSLQQVDKTSSPTNSPNTKN